MIWEILHPRVNFVRSKLAGPRHRSDPYAYRAYVHAKSTLPRIVRRKYYYFSVEISSRPFHLKCLVCLRRGWKSTHFYYVTMRFMKFLYRTSTYIPISKCRQIKVMIFLNLLMIFFFIYEGIPRRM